MVKLTGTFSKLEPVKVLVVGDLILDTYTIGKVGRISPEAPVGVVHVEREENRAGGAGNVALNLKSLGVEVVLVGRVGADRGGETLLKALTEEQIETTHVIEEPAYVTPVKNRIIAENQQIVRVDHEKVEPIHESFEKKIVQNLPHLLTDVKAVAISDYGKGLLTHSLIQAVIKEARAKGIPVIADPKGIDFAKYKGVTLLKPNTREAYIAANRETSVSIDQVAARIIEQCGPEILMITRGGEGISLFFKQGGREDFKPFIMREVKDVTGAGDTVLATVTLAIANGLTPGETAQLANISAGIAIEHFGCARVTLTQMAERLLEINSENKLFDEEHLIALQKVLEGQSFSVVGIFQNPGLTPAVFADIKRLKEKGRTLIYLRDEEPDEAFIHLLASLRDVDFLILQSESLKHLCEQIHPQHVYNAEADGIKPIEKVGELIHG